jgi:hypothetical protein
MTEKIELKYFTKKEALEDIKNTLLDGYHGYLCELHNELFNTDYYIISRHDAEKALEEYGIFKAIGEIVQYEEMHFGEIITDLSEPEIVANMLYYIVGIDTINEIMNENELLLNEWNNIVSDETRLLMLNIIDDLI